MLATSGVEIRAEALGGIGDTMVASTVVYFDGTAVYHERYFHVGFTSMQTTYEVISTDSL
jgi:hypothetical protein